LTSKRKQDTKNNLKEVKDDITLVDERVSVLVDLLIEKGVLKEGEYDQKMKDRLNEIVDLEDYDDMK
jgi:hypothetical protein